MRRSLILIAFVVAVILFATVALAAKATLDWTDNANNELGFNIQRQVGVCGSAVPWVDLAGVGANVKTYVDLTVVEGGDYCYRVNAWNTTDGTPGGPKQYSAWSNTAGGRVPFGVSVPPTGLGVVFGQ
jgi:hypothetical protein